jgi:hypothetical protein
VETVGAEGSIFHRSGDILRLSTMAHRYVVCYAMVHRRYR